MRKVLLILFLVLFYTARTGTADDQAETVSGPGLVFGEREILCSVEFSVNSSDLTPTARKILALSAPRLKELDFNKKLIRIEGFASPEGGRDKNYRLSLERARSVESFLRTEHGVSLNHYITGFGPKRNPGISVTGTRSVQVVIYDNPWGHDDIPVESTKGGQ